MKYKIIKGIKCYNPEIIDSFSNYPESGFNLNQDHKKSFFWTRSRNRVFKKILTQETIGLDNANFLEVNKGDIVFLSYFTIHRTSLCGNADRVRIACSTRYDNANEKTFIKRLYPTAYLRTVNRE